MSKPINTKRRQVLCKGCGAYGPEDRTDSRWWIPGIVVVEFKKHLAPGQIFGLTHLTSNTHVPWLDLNKFRQIVGGLLVKPPKWTFAFEPEHGPTDPDYKRYLTFHLQPDVNIPAIAAQLRKLVGVVHAAGEPRLLPPIRRIPLRPPEILFSAPVLDTLSATLSEPPLLNEPLAVSGGEPFGLSVSVGSLDLQNQWYLFRSKADLFIKSGKNGAGVVVADVDWGFNVDHQEFANDKIKFRHNAAKNNDDVSSGPKKWHGTATLGLIGAGDNDAGMVGFAAGADLWAIQAQDESENIDNSNWAKAIEKARLKSSEGKRKVILVEASTDSGFNVETSTLVRVPIKKAIADNCVVCVPAGNLGVDAEFDEAEDPIPIPATGSILVGATKYLDDPGLTERGISNWGPRVVVSAPGANTTDVTCCDCGNDTYRNDFGGTSGAAAKVAGAMALLLQACPDLTQEQIIRAFAKMPRIPTTITDQSIGCFLDLSELITQVNVVLAEDQ